MLISKNTISHFISSFVNKSKQIFYDKGKSDALKSILNQNKIELSKKLLYTAEVFYEMNINFRNMAKNNLDIKTSKTIVCNEIIKQNCQNCSNKIRCLKSFNTEIKDVFEKLINVGFEKGKITLVDLPAYLTNRCVKTSTIVNSFNKLLQEYKQYTKMLSNLDASKLLIADQFGGISHVLSMLAKQANEVTSQNEELQQTIQQNLIYENILPSEIVCFEKDCQTTEVALIVRNIDFDNSKIENVLSKTCGYKMVLINSAIVPNNPGFCCLFYSTAATYDIAVGFAQANKAGEDVCGDTYSILRLSNNKFMLSLCDGMGHGKKARNASDLSISLIENFYKAGFDNQTILTSVNSLLNMGREDTFSALDVSVIDLKSGEVDFIKQGATVGFIKNSKEINKIQSNSLPIGILQKVSPKITKTILSTEDIVIMLSDGVVDAFGEEQNLIDYLTRLPLKTPQEMANAILNKAKSKQKNYPKDDMTVLVGKLFFNCA
ncbi:MAG: SpoIIE family protein phosphatase [Clostridia bacterium]|nr:SpoIIE family protein phosphatase [Clostridia bacterium]